MNNFLTTLGDSLSLNYIGEYQSLYGEYKSFALSLSPHNFNEHTSSQSYLIKIPFANTEAITGDFTSFIETLKGTYTIIQKSAIYNNCFYAEFIFKSGTEDYGVVQSLIDDVINFSASKELTSSCEVCRVKPSTMVKELNDNLVICCDTCSISIDNHKEYETNQALHEQEKASRKPNFVLGTIGALLGSLIGVVLWVIIFKMGFIASICGVVMVICAMKGYSLFAGKLNTTGIIITLLITVVMVYASNYASYALELYSALSADGVTISESFSGLSVLMSQYPELKSEFNKNLFMGYGFTLLGTFSTFKRAFQHA